MSCTSSQRAHRKRLCELLLPLVSLASSAACADVLGLKEASLSGACSSEADCAPQESCDHGSCVPLTCNRGQRRCAGLRALRCGSDDRWETQLCTAICSDGECVPPKSCGPQQLVCGSNASCCKAIEINADRFDLQYTYPDPASDSLQLTADTVRRAVGHYALDSFEVSVGRFREYVLAYDTLDPPREGAGAHPSFPESGWRAAWNDDSDRLPGSQFALEGILFQHDVHLEFDADLTLPIRGVSWYMALAFCAWDGARLPSEAEWAYAAVGGSESREYPWQSDLAPPIDHNHAQYSDPKQSSDAPAHLGEHAEGRGAFEHEDLAGNVAEWVADMHQVRLPKTCPDPSEPSSRSAQCLQLEGTEDRVIRGGSFRDSGDRLRNTFRDREHAVRARAWIGFRCARDLDP